MVSNLYIIDSQQAKAQPKFSRKPPRSDFATSLMLKTKKPKSDMNRLVSNFGHSVASNLQAKANSMNHRSNKLPITRSLRFDGIDWNKLEDQKA